MVWYSYVGAEGIAGLDASTTEDVSLVICGLVVDGGRVGVAGVTSVGSGFCSGVGVATSSV